MEVLGWAPASRPPECPSYSESTLGGTPGKTNKCMNLAMNLVVQMQNSLAAAMLVDSELESAV